MKGITHWIWTLVVGWIAGWIGGAVVTVAIVVVLMSIDANGHVPNATGLRIWHVCTALGPWLGVMAFVASEWRAGSSKSSVTSASGSAYASNDSADDYEASSYNDPDEVAEDDADDGPSRAEKGAQYRAGYEAGAELRRTDPDSADNPLVIPGIFTGEYYDKGWHDAVRGEDMRASDEL